MTRTKSFGQCHSQHRRCYLIRNKELQCYSGQHFKNISTFNISFRCIQTFLINNLHEDTKQSHHTIIWIKLMNKTIIRRRIVLLNIKRSFYKTLEIFMKSYFEIFLTQKFNIDFSYPRA